MKMERCRLWALARITGAFGRPRATVAASTEPRNSAAIARACRRARVAYRPYERPRYGADTLARALAGAILLVFSASGCVGDAAGGATGFLGLELTAPAADIGEIRSLGLFAISIVPPEFECSDYTSGARDPISQTPENLVAVEYVDLLEGASEVGLSFSGIPVGDSSIIVEAYDGGGGRVFLGCGRARGVEEGRATALTIDMVDDPVARD